MCLSVCLSVCLFVCVSSNFLQITTALAVFCMILSSHDTWHTWPMCHYGKNLWNRSFKILILKFWGNFFNFKFGPSLWNSSSRTIYSRPTSVYFDVSIIWYSHVYLLCHIVMSGVFYYTVCRSEGLHIEWIVQKLKKKNPFTDLPKETQNILEYVFVCKTGFIVVP